MRVLVAGGTGAIGRTLLPLLAGAGHEVHATTRRSERSGALESHGAMAHVVDFLEQGAAESLVERVRPNVVIDQLTSLPHAFNPRKAKAAYAENDRIRRVGTGSLIEAAQAGGVGRYIVQSIAFIYRPGGPGSRLEDDPLWTDAPAPFDASIAVVAENERKVTTSSAFTGVALRYGFLYGPGTWYETGGSTYDAVKRRQYPLIGDGGGVNSLVHVSDAARATLASVEHGSGIYNVVDDDPAPFAELIPEFAQIIGAKPPRHVPVWLAALVAGKYMAAAATTLVGAGNGKARRELGWAPQIPSWRTGFADFRDSCPPS